MPDLAPSLAPPRPAPAPPRLDGVALVDAGADMTAGRSAELRARVTASLDRAVTSILGR